MDRATKRQLKREERARRKEEKLRRKANRKQSVLLQEFWNLPNMLTLGRIFLIPIFVWFTYEANPLDSLWAAVIFTVAAVTDVVDGVLARRWNLVTVVGKFMDPLADKLIAMAALVMMVRLGRIAAWVAIVLLARELIISGLRTIAASEGLVIAAGQEGKWKTSLQLTGLICLCVHYTHSVAFPWGTYPVDFNAAGQVLIYVSMAMSIWSAVGYFQAFLKVLAGRGGGSGVQSA